MIFTKKIIKHKYETEVKYFPRVKHTEANRERKDRELDPNNLDISILESIARTKRVIKDYARNNDFDYFVTLTFDPKKFDNFSIETVYHLTKMFLQKLRRYNSDLKYLLVPEYHADKQKIHLHGYIKGDLCLQKALDPSKNGEILTFKGKTIYNLPQWNYGYSTALKIGKSVNDTLRCSSYITKYVTKDLLISFNQKRYWASKNLFKGVCVNQKEVIYNDIQELREKELNKLIELTGVESTGDIRTFENEYYYNFTATDR